MVCRLLVMDSSLTACHLYMIGVAAFKWVYLFLDRRTEQKNMVLLLCVYVKHDNERLNDVNLLTALSVFLSACFCRPHTNL